MKLGIMGSGIGKVIRKLQRHTVTCRTRDNKFLMLVAKSPAHEDLVEYTDSALNCWDFRPQSLWECHSLLRNSLPRDHLLVKGLEGRNIISFSDITTGVSTESTKEAMLRRSLAIQYVESYLCEISPRNVRILGEGLARSLLAIETDTDEDGIPLEAAENRIVRILAVLLTQMEIRGEDKRVVPELLTSIVMNQEILFYTKYKLINAIRKSVSYLESGGWSDEPIPLSNRNDSPHKDFLMDGGVTQPAVSILRADPKTLSILATNYSSKIMQSVESCICQILASANSSNQVSLFANSLLLIELMEMQLFLFGLKSRQPDLTDIEKTIAAVGGYICRSSAPVEADVCKMFLKTLLSHKIVLHDLVEDEQLLGMLRRALGRMREWKHLDDGVQQIIAEIRDCVFPIG